MKLHQKKMPELFGLKIREVMLLIPPQEKLDAPKTTFEHSEGTDSNGFCG